MTTSLREHWRAGRTTLGAWLSIPSTVSAEATARAGFDYVCIDTQHGAIEYSDAVPMIQAILLGGSCPIVRAPWNEPGIIGKLLDAGALGIIVPMVNSVAEAEAAVSACRYAPDGARSFGPGMVAPRVEGSYVDWAREHVAAIPMIETAQAVEVLDDILAVEGIDAVYVGPADLSLTLGLTPRGDNEEDSFNDALAAVVAACDRAGVVPGIQANRTLTPKRLANGFKMVTVTTDMLAMRYGLDEALARANDSAADAEAGGLY